jgi:hypothetical protein
LILCSNSSLCYERKPFWYMVTYFVAMFTFMSLRLCLGWLCCNCHNPHAHDSSHDAHDTWATWLIVNCRELFANVATHHWIRPPKTCQQLESKRGLTFTIVCVLSLSNATCAHQRVCQLHSVSPTTAPPVLGMFFQPHP